MEPSSAQLWPVWQQAAAQPLVDAAIRGIYGEATRSIAQKGPQCWASGRCCHFDTFDHRLYVTGLEIAWVLFQCKQAMTSTMPRGIADDCVFQQGHLCGIHAHRPLGCRLFFCQRGSDCWQHELYEQMLQELRRLHVRHGLPYRYMEWRAGLLEATQHGLISQHPTEQ